MVREFGAVVDSGIGERKELTGWGKETFWDDGNFLCIGLNSGYNSYIHMQKLSRS